MEKNKQQESPAQGAGLPPITPTLVKEFLRKDLSVAIACLQAIASDPDLLDSLSHFMAGRWHNNQNSKADGPNN